MGSIPFNATEEEIHNYFEEVCGGVLNTKLIYNRDTGESKGKAFVKFES